MYQRKSRKTVSRQSAQTHASAEGTSLRPPVLSQVLQRNPDEQGGTPTPVTRQDFVFLMGQDAANTGNAFYTEAKGFFQQEQPQATLVSNLRDLHAVMNYLQSLPKGTKVGQLFLVTHAHRSGRVSFGLDSQDTDAHIGEDELKNGLGNLPQVADRIDAQTVIRIKGCNLGRNAEMVELFDKAFGGGGKVVASTHEQRYSHSSSGGTTKYEEALTGPTLERPGKQKFSKKEVKDFVSQHYGHLSAAQQTTLVQELHRAQKVESRTDEAFGGEVPATKEQALKAYQGTLKQGGFVASACTSISKQVKGGNTVITYAFSGSMNGNSATTSIDVEVPTEAAAVSDMKQQEEVSERYDFTAKSEQKGSNLSIKVTQSRVIAYLHHRGLDESAAKPFQPPESDAFFYTTSS